ncbi:MAG: hypothetical protein D6788_01045 [Planctomycetota bacterium]|nr:MAG: hypothetical protein D6788_01045 [Planctomycetota bacterium]
MIMAHTTEEQTIPKGYSGRGSARVMAYCHDGVGLGHLRRTLNICQHVGAGYPNVSFLVATGSPYISLFGRLPRVDYLKLPSLRKVDNERYEAKFLQIEQQDVLACRRRVLLETARSYDPKILLVDKAPAGVCGELVETLEWLRKHRPQTRIVFGMRDIEDDPETTIRQWTRLGVPQLLDEWFDEVWVYGMRELYDVARAYALSDSIRAKLRFMGYVARPTCAGDCLEATWETMPQIASYKRRVLVTVGGGTDGTAVLETYLEEAAGRLASEGIASLLVGGPDLPEEDAQRLRNRARRLEGTFWFDFLPCLGCVMRRSEAVVCMGGYNTLCEVINHGKRALVIPRTTPRVEQAIRAELWSQHGLVHVLNPARLGASVLADQVLALLSTAGGPSPHRVLDLGGLERIRHRFGTLLNGSARHAGAVSM